MPTNQQTAIFLRRLGALLELDGQARSRTRNLNDAADTIEKHPSNVDQDTLNDETFRIGEEPREELTAYLASGTTPLHDSLKDKYPTGLLDIVQIPRIGATRALALQDQLGVNNLDDLIKVAASGDIVKIKGIGPKNAKTILKAAEALKDYVASAPEDDHQAPPSAPTPPTHQEAPIAQEPPAATTAEKTMDPLVPSDNELMDAARKEAMAAMTSQTDDKDDSQAASQAQGDEDDSARRIRESLKDATDQAQDDEASEETNDSQTQSSSTQETPKDTFADSLRCNACHHEGLHIVDGAAQCDNCGRRYAIEDNIIDMIGSAASSTSPAQRIMETESYSSVYENIGRPLLTRLVTSRSLDESYALNTELLRIEPGQTIVDIACGPGNFTRRFADAAHSAQNPSTTIGVDMSMAMLTQARQQLGNQHGLHYMRADANHLPFADNSVDRIHCAGAIHLFNNPQTALREFVRVLKPGGLMVISAFEKNAAMADLIPKLSGPAALLLFPALPAYFAVSAGASVADKLKDFSLKRFGIRWLDKGELTDIIRELGADIMMSSQEGMEITIQARKA